MIQGKKSTSYIEKKLNDTHGESSKMKEFDDFLNNTYGSITVAGIVIKAAQALKECDPIAYRCFKSDLESEL